MRCVTPVAQPQYDRSFGILQLANSTRGIQRVLLAVRSTAEAHSALHAQALIVPKLGAPKDENPVVLIKDNDDGSYTGVYTVSARGNYEVNI